MDMKTGLISEKDFEKVCSSVMEVNISRQRMMERQHDFSLKIIAGLISFSCWIMLPDVA